MAADKSHADVDYDTLAEAATALAAHNKDAARAFGDGEACTNARRVELHNDERRHQELLATQYQLLSLLEQQLAAIVERLDRIEGSGP